jgi:hypothetical protein
LRAGNKRGLTQISLSLSVLGFRFVILAAMRPIHFTGAGEPKTLFGSTMGFLFRHYVCPPNLFSSLS